MKSYLALLVLLLAGALITMLGLSLADGGFWSEPEPTGEEWCEMMMDKPNGEWTDAETRSFARTCLND